MIRLRILARVLLLALAAVTVALAVAVQAQEFTPASPLATPQPVRPVPVRVWVVWVSGEVQP